MKYTVKIEDRIYEVEIGNLHSRPIMAYVNGVPVEVWPESEIIASGVAPGSIPTLSTSPHNSPISSTFSQTPLQESQSAEGSSPNTMIAPIPGVVTSVTVVAGDEVGVGQEICALEAMKMKNIIRATRRGIIADVYISAGLTVNHGDILIKFAE